jgi:hypothetical protein
MLDSDGLRRPAQRLPNSIDDRAAVFLIPTGGSLSSESVHPEQLPNRLCVNGADGFEFENDIFVGKIIIIHRELENCKHPYRYREFFQKRRRRWELRWQGKFKKPIATPIIFGAEISADKAPRHSFASRTFLSVLLRFSQTLARNRGSDLFTNILNEDESGTKYFHFPVHASDLILATDDSSVPPDVTSPDSIEPSDIFRKCNADFRNNTVDISKTYTFIFYSMYVDFVSWDIQNVPIGLNGMSLNRLVGNQSISVVMKPKSSNSDYMRLIIGNRCTSPEWSSFLTSGNSGSITQFFSAISSVDSDSFFSSPHRQQRRIKAPQERRGGIYAIFRGIKRIITAPPRYIATCLRAPMSFVIDPEQRKVPRVIVRDPSVVTPPQPDAGFSSPRSEFATPISRE